MSTEQELKKISPSHKEFQNLLDKDFKDRKLKENEIIKATVTEITKNFIVVDCKAKMEGMIPIEDFKNDDRVSGMIFDPTGMSIASSYAINLANLIKDIVDSGKEVVVRGVYWNDTSYLIASGASEISGRVIGGLPDNNFNINGFGGSSLYLKDFFEKFLITPRIVVGGEFKTGPETFLRSDMSDEQ